MEFQTLKQSHLKRNIIIGVVVVAVIAAIVISFTRAKYRTAQSMPLINGTVNYSLADLNIVAMYVGGVEVDSLDASKQYTLDTTRSTCTYKDGSTIEGLNISYDTATGSLSISPFTTKGTKCYLYFDEQASIKDTLLTYYPTVLTRTNFSTTVTNTTTGTIYKSSDSSQYDDDGEVYYFAGNPTDNWVSFAGFYWRIIRINGDGSIRLIYSGDGSAQTTGSGTRIGTSAFNASPNYDRSEYVGLKYTEESQHGTDEDSTIMGKLNTWYSTNIQNAGYSTYIDTNAGFCGDREMASGYTWGSQPYSLIYYKAYERLYTNKSPSFKCTNKSGDLFTVSSSNQGNKSLQYPIGLITADEVAYAGGVGESSNESYYLYTGQNYWTLSPTLGGYAHVFNVYSSGSLNYNDVSWAEPGVRPVINLKANTQFTGSGTSSNPYVVV